MNLVKHINPSKSSKYKRRLPRSLTTKKLESLTGRQLIIEFNERTVNPQFVKISKNIYQKSNDLSSIVQRSHRKLLSYINHRRHSVNLSGASRTRARNFYSSRRDRTIYILLFFFLAPSTTTLPGLHVCIRVWQRNYSG